MSKFQKNVNDAINPSGGYFLFGAVLLLGKFSIYKVSVQIKSQQTIFTLGAFELLEASYFMIACF